MTKLKTQKNDASVEVFLDAIVNEKKRQDSYVLLDLMCEITGQEPAMWGNSIVGFGGYRYKYASGRENEWFQVGFSPRKQSLTLYIMSGFGEYEVLLADLGKHKTGRSCLYVKHLSDIDLDVLRELIQQSVAYIKATQNISAGDQDAESAL